MSSPSSVSGTVLAWSVNANDPAPRRYVQLAPTFAELDALSCVDTFNARSGEGEQRSLVDTHVRKLRREMAASSFTPAGVTLGTRACHRAAAVFAGDSVTLDLAPGRRLPLLDGQQRLAALRRLLKEREDDGDAAGAQLIRDLRIPTLLLLDGETKADFIRLQDGKAVDTTTLLSLRLSIGAVTGKNAPYVGKAFAIARVLHTDLRSPFERLVKFDSRSSLGLSVTTLCARSASDLSYSLVGLAKVCDDPKKAAEFVCVAYETLKARTPHLLEPGKLLTPPPEGTKGSATLLLTVAIGLAHLAATRAEDVPGEDTMSRVADAANAVFDGDVGGNLSAATKRELAGQYVTELFTDEDVAKHDGAVPLELVHLLSASCLAASPLPKVAKPKPKPAPKKNVKTKTKA